MAIAPLLTALLGRIGLGHRLPPRTWIAIVVAGAGIAWMYAHELAATDARQLVGTLVALAVPVAAAVNWTVLQKSGRAGDDLLPAVLVGAVVSSAATFVPALPFAATSRDVGLLALLGVAQLAVPCLIAVVAARRLAAAEAALLSLLEIVFGVTWTWLGANEVPTGDVLLGGALVLAALVGNEALALRSERGVAAAT